MAMDEPDASASIVSRIAARVAARMSEAGPVPAPPAPWLRGPLHEAAAVVVWFQPEVLARAALVDPRGDSTEARSLLLADSTLSPTPGDERRWTLKPHVRIAVLRTLREDHRLAEVLARSPNNDDDVLDRMLRLYLEGQAPPVAAMTEEELASAREVTDWLRSAGFTGLPVADEILGRFEWQALLRPFEHIAGEHFGGRAAELDALRTYVGVLPPATLMNATRATVARVLNLTQQPPLVIHGPGGVGKSTLVARFILEHARAHEADRFPFVYLDFDRSEISHEQPITLLVEAVRQIGVQYAPSRGQCDALRRAWLEDFAPAPGGAAYREHARTVLAPAALAALLTRAARDFATLLGSIGASNRPVVFVLDTFEEVQRRGDENVARIWRLLEDLQAAIPRLRVVIAGRADVPGRRTQTLALSGLDQQAAVAYLMKRGIHDRAIAERIAAQLHGTPLSLKLAAEVISREGIEEMGGLDVSTREFLFLRVDDAIVQRQLYNRILSYIPDEEVRRLAHPGLVLRMLTPELILEVLREPCGLTSVTNLKEATALFEKIEKDVSLVTAVDDHTVRHRSDLRALMVPLVRGAEAAKAADIDRRAVAYYARFDNAVPRAEEIYHRLWLDEPLSGISMRWVDGVEPHLVTAIEEFTGARKAYLAARLELDVDEDTRRLADLEDWEQLTARKALEMLAANDPAGALQAVGSRADRSPGSPIPAAEARALVALGRGEEALRVLEHGIQLAIAAGRRAHSLALVTDAAKVVIRFEYSSRTPLYSSLLEHLAQASDGPLEKLAIAAPRLALELLRDSRNMRRLAPQASEVAALFDTLTDDEVKVRPELAMWAAVALGEPLCLARVARLIAISPIRPADIRTLAGEVARFDASMSAAEGAPPGILARRFGLPLRATVTETWSDFAVKNSGEALQRTVATLLVEYAGTTPGVGDAVRRLLRFALGLESDTEDYPPFPAEVAQRTAVNPSQLTALELALCDAFPSTAVWSELLKLRLSRRLEAIVSPSLPLPVLVSNVVATAQREGWLPALVTAALDARPNDQRLPEVARAFGVVTLTSVFGHIIRGMPSLTVDSMALERLPLLEGQVCRVEVGGRLVSTGFLVGPDLVLTVRDGLDPLFSGRIKPADVAVRFDVRGTEGAGNAFALASDWLASLNSEREEGHALLRLRESAGDQPIGAATLERVATLRRWIEIPAMPRAPEPGDGLIILHHTGGPLAVAVNPKGVRAISPDGTRLYHSLSTEPGSIGAPCFTLDMELVAMHMGSESGLLGRRGYALLMGPLGLDLGFHPMAFS
jgi:hypothetical protein